MNRTEYRKSIVDTNKLNSARAANCAFADSPGWAYRRFTPDPYKVPIRTPNFVEAERNWRISNLRNRLHKHVSERVKNARVRMELQRLAQYAGPRLNVVLAEIDISFGGNSAESAAAKFGLRENA